MVNRPNILLVVADCGRSDRWLGAGRTTVTPNVDRLASEGISFPTMIAEKSCTTPNFASLVTGQYSPRHGVMMVFGYRLPDQVPTLVETLTTAGYHTYAEVTGPLMPGIGLTRGFEHYEYRAPFDYLHTAWGDRFVERLKTGHYRGPWFIMLHLWELHIGRQILPEFRDSRFGVDDYEQAVSSLDAQLGRVFDAAGDDTMTIFTADHGEKTAADTFPADGAIPYVQGLLGIKDEAQQRKRRKGMPLFKLGMIAGPSVVHQAYAQLTPMIRSVSLRAMSKQPPPSRWTQLRDKFRAFRMIPKIHLRDLLSIRKPLKTTEMMHDLGLLDADQARAKLDRLAETMGRDRMLDMHLRMAMNNFARNMHNGHGFHVYEFLARIPCIVRWPGHLPAGVVCDRMVRQPDLLPTVLDLLGIDTTGVGPLDGQSFGALIRGEPWQPQPAYLSLTGMPADIELRGVRTEDAKYTFAPENPDLPEELYDLRNDPTESTNLATSDPDRCAELRALANGFVETGSQAPVVMMQMDPDEQRKVEDHLRDLGYID